MPLNIDLHTHSFFSGDGISSPEDMIAAARAKGLHGIAITDHNTCDAVNYLLQKGLMRLDGLPVNDFLILPGVEVTTADGHLLCIGAELPYLKGKPAREVCDIIHERGGLAIPPHPYDLFRAGIRLATLETLTIDAIEVFNAATTLRRYNRYAFKYAQVRGLPMTAASDAHHAAAVGTAYTILNTAELSVKGVLAQILKSNELNQKYLTPRDSIRKTWNNWLRLRRKKLPDITSRDRGERAHSARSVLHFAPCAPFRVAHASRVLVSASRRNSLHRKVLGGEEVSELVHIRHRSLACKIFTNVRRRFSAHHRHRADRLV